MKPGFIYAEKVLFFQNIDECTGKAQWAAEKKAFRHQKGKLFQPIRSWWNIKNNKSTNLNAKIKTVSRIQK